MYIYIYIAVTIEHSYTLDFLLGLYVYKQVLAFDITGQQFFYFLNVVKISTFDLGYFCTAESENGIRFISIRSGFCAKLI